MSVNPDDIFVKHKAVLFLNRRQEIGTSDARQIGKTHGGKAAEIWLKWHSQQTQIARDIRVSVRLEAMRIDAVVSEAELIQQSRREGVDFAQSQAGIAVVLVAGSKTAAVKLIRERSRSENRLVLITETHEEVIPVRELVVHTNVKIVLRR